MVKLKLLNFSDHARPIINILKQWHFFTTDIMKYKTAQQKITTPQKLINKREMARLDQGAGLFMRELVFQ